MNHQTLSNFIWPVVDLQRGDYKQSEFGRVILPFTVLRRADCVLAPTRSAVLAEVEAGRPDPFLLRAAGQIFFNRTAIDLDKLVGDQDNIDTNLLSNRTITVERSLRDEAGKPVLGQKGKFKGKPQPASAMRDTENESLVEDVVPSGDAPRTDHQGNLFE